MANKVIVYTSNIGFTPSTLDEVIEFAKNEPKFYICEVGLNDYLANVKVGDNLITKKGNSLFVLKTFDTTVDNLTGNDADYVDDLARNYGLRKQNITSVANRIKFETWCKYARPLVKTEETKMNTNSFKNFGERLKALFMPVKANDIRVATDGNICVATANGYVTIDAENNLVSYPEELTLDLPVFIMAKPVDQLQVGDVIARDRSYGKVVAIKDGKIKVVGYTGAGSTVYPIKDFLFNQTMIRVVVSFVGNIGGQLNPMMLLALSGNKKDSSLLPFLMMSQNGGALTANPMMLAMLAGDGDVDFKDLLMYSAFSGQGMNLFGAPVANPVKVATPEAVDAE